MDVGHVSRYAEGPMKLGIGYCGRCGGGRFVRGEAWLEGRGRLLLLLVVWHVWSVVVVVVDFVCACSVSGPAYVACVECGGGGD
jgi:hypothetical protein